LNKDTSECESSGNLPPWEALFERKSELVTAKAGGERVAEKEIRSMKWN